MRLYNFTIIILIFVSSILTTKCFSQETFESRKELNDYIFQNSDLENITNGYLLDLNPDFTPEIRDSFFSRLNSDSDFNELISVFKIIEDSDVKSEFSMDSILFPAFNKLYSNDGVSDIKIPLFIFDMELSELDSLNYNNISNWSSSSPFYEFTSSNIESRDLHTAGLFVDTLFNQNIELYWNENTFFSNTNRDINRVQIDVNGTTVQLLENQVYQLKDYFSGSISSINVIVEFSDSTSFTMSNDLYINNFRNKDDCENIFDFSVEDPPWEELGDLCTWGYDVIENNNAPDFPSLGINFSVLWGCGAPKILDKPYIIVAGWGTLTDSYLINSSQEWPSSIEDIYEGYNQEGFIDNLVEAGFDVVIAKINPPNQSILKNSILIEKLISKVNEEKFSNGSYQENIISGYSAGSMAVRLALQHMEKEHLDGSEKHHHSKLYVSFDGEQQGANVPLGLQHGVKFLKEKSLDDFISYPNSPIEGGLTYANVYALHYILNAPLSQELLKYFHTETGSEQNPGQGSSFKRTLYLSYHNLYNHSKNSHIPGYPSFTRNISISNGTSESDISGSSSDHFPYPNGEGLTFFDKEECFFSLLSPERIECSFLEAGTNHVFKRQELNIFNNWNIIDEKWTKDPLVLDNAPGGSSFLSAPNTPSSEEPNTMYQVLKALDFIVDCPGSGTVNYEALYSFTPTLLTHDIRNFDPNLTNGRMDYDMKEEGLMFESLIDVGNISNASPYYGYPHLAHPLDHYSAYTPFDAVFSWDQQNTVHINSGNPVLFNDYYPNNIGRWFQEFSNVRGVIKNFILDETDFYNAYIQNRIYGWNARSDYEYFADIIAMNNIYAGKEITQRTDFKPAEILENANVHFKAGKMIHLKSGFHAKSGSVFHAEIGFESCGGKSNVNNNSSDEVSSSVGYNKNQLLSNAETSRNPVMLFPNPTSGQFTLSISNKKESSIDENQYIILNLTGNLIDKGLIDSGNTQLKLETGVYIVKVKIREKWFQRKLVVL